MFIILNAFRPSQCKQMLSDAGYGITTRVLDASRCGVPQKRQRFFLVGKLGERDGFLDEALTSNLSNKQMTVRDYLGDTLNTEFYYMHPRSYNRRAVFSIDEPAATIRGINRPIRRIICGIMRTRQIYAMVFVL